jgi:hypothetical protein
MRLVVGQEARLVGTGVANRDRIGDAVRATHREPVVRGPLIRSPDDSRDGVRVNGGNVLASWLPARRPMRADPAVTHCVTN